MDQSMEIIRRQVIKAAHHMRPHPWPSLGHLIHPTWFQAFRHTCQPMVELSDLKCLGVLLAVVWLKSTCRMIAMGKHGGVSEIAQEKHSRNRRIRFGVQRPSKLGYKGKVHDSEQGPAHASGTKAKRP